MERIEKHQERHEQYFDRLGDNYEHLYQQQMEFNQQYHARMLYLESQMEQLSMAYAQQPPHPLILLTLHLHPLSSHVHSSLVHFDDATTRGRRSSNRRRRRSSRTISF